MKYGQWKGKRRVAVLEKVRLGKEEGEERRGDKREGWRENRVRRNEAGEGKREPETSN